MLRLTGWRVVRLLLALAGLGGAILTPGDKVEAADYPLGRVFADWPAGSQYGSYVFTPPAPLANTRIYPIRDPGVQQILGDGDEDLLLVAPAQYLTGKIQIDVRGFRGIYMIGASFDVDKGGTMISPNGSLVPSFPAVLKLQTSRYPVSRPFIYVSRIRLKNTKLKCCDFMQAGGAAPVGEWGAWPDIYRYKILADGYYGWATYNGGSYGINTNHADFLKIELGGVRHTFAADIDVKWGYQTEYMIASGTTNFVGYQGPDGFGEHHYWNYVNRLQVNPALGSTTSPATFFMARGSVYVSNGEYYSFYFHEGEAQGQGKGVYAVPVKGRSLRDGLKPNNGAFGPIQAPTHWSWPAGPNIPGRLPFATGRLIDGSIVTPPTVVTEDEVGWQRRITTQDELVSYIAQMKGDGQ